MCDINVPKIMCDINVPKIMCDINVPQTCDLHMLKQCVA